MTDEDDDDGTELRPCRADIFASGVQVGIVRPLPPAMIETWVRAVRGWAQHEAVDWHFFAGRGRILALGSEAEIARVQAACTWLMPALEPQPGRP